MNNLSKISTFFNVLFIILLVIAVLYIGFSFTKSLYIGLFDDKNLVKDKLTISELQECITKYYDYIYYKQYQKARYATSILSRKSDEEYEEIHNSFSKYDDYVVCVKYAYKLYGNTYRCYVVTYDKTDDLDIEYVVNNDTLKMNTVVITLDRFNNKFSIISDDYYSI